jgi:hypothetical protein
VKKPKLTSSGNIEEFRQKHNEKDVAKPLLSHKFTSSGNIEEFRQKHNEKDVAKPLLSHKCCQSLQVTKSPNN